MPQFESIVSPNIYNLILASSRLTRLLLPEDTAMSPYEVLDYDATLTLDEPDGMRATFFRRQRLRFLQDGVAAILDHYWGDGVTIAGYRHTGGVLADSFRDEGRHHEVIELPYRMTRGETLSFDVTRLAMVGFTQVDEYVETNVDHPIHRLIRRVIFPTARPCRQATASDGRSQLALPIETGEDGRTMVELALESPRPNTPYRITWAW
jgi:hypothetical protein